MTKEKAIDTLLNLLMIAGLSFGLAFLLNEVDANRHVTSASESLTLEHVDRETIQQNQDAEVSYDWSDIQPVSAENIEAALDGVNIYDLPVIGAIAIPDIDLNLPIMNGVSDEAMFTGASTLSADQRMGEGNYALASHRSMQPDVLFGGLADTTAGMPLYLSDMETVYEYEIVSNEVVEPTRMDVLDPTNDPTVTLITCTLDSSQRVIVKAQLKATHPIEEAPEDVLEALSVDPQNIYSNDHQ